MRAAVSLVAMFGLLPAMTGPLPASQEGGAQGRRVIEAALCNGGAIVIPIEGPASPGGGGTAPCCAKGCHAGSTRKRFDRAQ